MVLQRRKTAFSFWRFTFILLFLFPFPIFAQRATPFPNREFNLYLDNYLVQDTSHFNLYENEVLHYRKLESLDSILYPRKQKKNYFVRKLRRQNFVHVNNNDFYLTLDPLFNFNGGLDLQDTLNEKLITNSRGVSVRGNIGKQFSFESSFLENQSTFPAYVDAFADTFKVTPGQGRWKKFKTNGFF